MQVPRLRQWREFRALTQVELAERSGVSARSIAGYEGGAGARPATVRALSAALDVQTSDLLEVPDAPKVRAPPRSPEADIRAAERRNPTDRRMAEKLIALRDENLRAASRRGLSRMQAEEIALRAEGVFDVVHEFTLGDDPDSRAMLDALQEFCTSVSSVLQAAAQREADEEASVKLVQLADGWKNAA